MKQNISINKFKNMFNRVDKRLSKDNYYIRLDSVNYLFIDEDIYYNIKFGIGPLDYEDETRHLQVEYSLFPSNYNNIREIETIIYNTVLGYLEEFKDFEII